MPNSPIPSAPWLMYGTGSEPRDALRAGYFEVFFALAVGNGCGARGLPGAPAAPVRPRRPTDAGRVRAALRREALGVARLTGTATIVTPSSTPLPSSVRVHAPSVPLRATANSSTGIPDDVRIAVHRPRSSCVRAHGPGTPSASWGDLRQAASAKPW